MNKYQEALDLLFMWAINAYCALEADKDCAEYLILKELIDKATPKKPSFEGDGYADNGEIDYDTWVCPNCETKYEVDYQEYEHCPECGQAIDWSEDE